MKGQINYKMFQELQKLIKVLIQLTMHEATLMQKFKQVN